VLPRRLCRAPTVRPEVSKDERPLRRCPEQPETVATENSVTESKFRRTSSKMRSALCVSGGSLAMSVAAAAPGDDKEREVDTIERGRTCLNYATRCKVP